MMNEGFLKIFRKMTAWEWYTDIPCKVLFFHCLLRANFKEGRFKGKIINPGQFVTSYKNLSEETGLSVKQIRYALNKLKLTRELAHVGQGSYSIITVNNWDKFQSIDTQIGNRLALVWQQ